MSLYHQTYGPINKYTTMFKPFKKGHPNYVGEDNTPFAKSFVRYDLPKSMQYPGRFDTKKWYSVNMQHAARERKLKKREEQAANRKRNMERSSNGLGIPRKKVISFAKPSWTTPQMREEINRMKNLVKKLNGAYGLNRFSLDHIIPLRGELVSGLHIPENLRVIATKVNNEKGNDFEID